MKKKKVTIHDIAAELKINSSTVSRALSDHPRISEQTKQKVLEVAKALNYDYNHLAAALRKGKSKTVGVIVPKLDRAFFASIVRGIEEKVNEAGYHVIVCQSSDDFNQEQANVDALLRTRVDGIIVSISSNTRSFEHFQKIRQKGVPLILYDRVQDSLGVSTVEIDDRKGGFIATQHLIDQGCRHIAHFAGPQQLGIYKNRKAGYLDALEQNGLKVDPRIIFSGVVDVNFGQRNTTEMLDKGYPFDAIFSASDFSAIGAMRVLKSRGFRIPDDIALVGFSNEPFTEYTEPTLTTVNQYSMEIGRTAAQLFIEEVNRQNRDGAQHQIRLQPSLLIRGSSVRSKNQVQSIAQ